MQTIKALDVLFEGQKVGKLALTPSRTAAFQYDREWLVNGFSVSPISLPLTDEVFYPKNDAIEGLFGVVSVFGLLYVFFIIFPHLYF